MIKLKAIGKEMATQNNLATQYPLWVIQVDTKAYVGYYDSWEHQERPNLDVVDGDTFDKGLCKACREVYYESGELKDECGLCDYDTFWYYNIEPKLEVDSAGVFFTQKACQFHINDNHYHYWNPRPYAVSAWRNPEMVAVMQHLIVESGEKIPSHYT